MSVHFMILLRFSSENPSPAQFHAGPCRACFSFSFLARLAIPFSRFSSAIHYSPSCLIFLLASSLAFFSLFYFFCVSATAFSSLSLSSFSFFVFASALSFFFFSARASLSSSFFSLVSISRRTAVASFSASTSFFAFAIAGPSPA